MGYIQPTDLVGATTQYISASGTAGVDFTLYTTPQLQGLIDRVTNQIDGFCRQSFALANIQERYTGGGTNHLRLRRYPLAQIEDSVFGGGGSVSQSLVVDTTITGNVSVGATAVPLADCSNVLAGQYLQWDDTSGESGIAIASVSATSGAGNATLKSALAKAHTSGARAVVNTLDFIQIVLPGQAVFPIPIQQLVVDAQKGSVMNYTPLMFQSLGYATIFPRMLPLLARYTYGFLANQVPGVLKEVSIEQCRRVALMSGNLGAGGIQEAKLDDQSVRYASWKPIPLGEDLQDLLGPFRRNVGFA